MARIDERSRREMHDSLVHVHGEQVADTLMELLPADGWADMATKQDLAHTREVLGARIDTLETSMLAGFSVIDERFKGVDERFKGIDGRFNSIDGRFNSIDERFKGIDERLRGVDRRFVALESTIDERFDRMDTRIDAIHARLDGLVVEMNKQTWRLVTAMLAAVVAVAGLPQVLEHTLG
jgi:hypothetical protein